VRNAMKILIGAALAAILVIAASAQQSAPLKVIGFMSDFDLKDDAVGLCKAVMDGVAPGVRVIDITHQAEPYNIAMGARYLAGVVPYFPKDAVFIVVIDPGVGSTRKAIVARSRVGQTFVLPDNGLLTLIQDRDGIAEAHEITNPAWMIGSGISSTFHGRDIFSPTAGRAARGDDIAQAGPALDLSKLVRCSARTGLTATWCSMCPPRHLPSSATNWATRFPSPSLARATSFLWSEHSAMCRWARSSFSSTRADGSPLASTSATSPRPTRWERARC